MKPISEPSQGRDNAYLGWTDAQLLRRPPIPATPGGTLPWASAEGFFCEDAPQTDAFRFLDFNTGATNAPTIFNFATGPQGALGLEINEVGAYRIWSSVTFDVHYDTLSNARDFAASQFFDYITFFANLDQHFNNGINTYSLDSTQDFAIFYTSYHVDIFVYEASGLGLLVTSTGPPFNVIEMGMAQNTTFGGCWNSSIMVYQLDTGPIDPNTGDFADVTYLEGGT